MVDIGEVRSAFSAGVEGLTEQTTDDWLDLFWGDEIRHLDRMAKRSSSLQQSQYFNKTAASVDSQWSQG